MFPYELDGKTFWPKDKATAKFREIRASARETILAEDRANGIPENGAVCFAAEDGGQIVMRVDPRLSALKHSGEDLTDLTGDLWDEFCSQPRDSDEFVLVRPVRVKRKREVVSPSTPPKEEVPPKEKKPRLSRMQGMIG